MKLAELKQKLATAIEVLAETKDEDEKVIYQKKIDSLTNQIANLENEEAEKLKADLEKANAEKEKSEKAKAEKPKRERLTERVAKEAVKDAEGKECKPTAIELLAYRGLTISQAKELVQKAEAIQRERNPKPSEKRVKKRVTTVLSTGIIRTVASAVRREMGADKVSKIKVDALKESHEHFKNALASLKTALGGISSESFIDTFSKEMNDLIEAVKEKQKAVKE
ncbi:MAG: hypothetical protein RLZZ175_2766 [Bacteroidota bacterium]|jgi:hypothetical protein